MISITLAIVIALVVTALAVMAAVLYCRRHSGKCEARIEGILSEKALEISEPMTMVIGPLSMLIKKEPSGSPNRRMLQIALANAERISSIMGLELSGKQTAKSTLKKDESRSSREVQNARGTKEVKETREAISETEDLRSEDSASGEDGEKVLTDAIGEALNDADAFLEKAQNVVNDHIDDSSFDKDTFATEMFVSPSTLYKKIKQLSGLSPTDYIKEIRLAKALSLVEETDLPISAISDMCGFSTVAYFGYTFRKRYGVTPSEKRKVGRD